MDPYSLAVFGPDCDYEVHSPTATGPCDEREPRYNEVASRFVMSAAKILDQCEDMMIIEIRELISRELDGLMPLDDEGYLVCTHQDTINLLWEALQHQMVVYTCDTRSLQRLVCAFKLTTGVGL